jgi:hypothetical protein
VAVGGEGTVAASLLGLAKGKTHADPGITPFKSGEWKQYVQSASWQRACSMRNPVSSV